MRVENNLFRSLFSRRAEAERWMVRLQRVPLVFYEQWRRDEAARFDAQPKYKYVRALSVDKSLFQIFFKFFVFWRQITEDEQAQENKDPMEEENVDTSDPLGLNDAREPVRD